MTIKKPERRLVGWMEYVKTVATRGATYSFAGFCVCVGSFVLLGGVVWLLSTICEVINNYSEAGVPGDAFLQGTIGASVCVFGVIGVMMGIAFYQDTKQKAPVALLTKSTAKHLPEVETLVRSSDQPETNLSGELVRATHYETETLAEQLLRSTQENGQKV